MNYENVDKVLGVLSKAKRDGSVFGVDDLRANLAVRIGCEAEVKMSLVRFAF